MTLKDFLMDFVQEPHRDYVTQASQVSVAQASAPAVQIHESAPDIWFEILPFLDQRSKILDQMAEIPPELLQD